MVILGLIGLPSAGKRTVVAELCTNHGFECIEIADPNGVPSIGSLDLNSPVTKTVAKTVSEAAELAMSNWNKNHVLLGLNFSEETIEFFKKKPLFVMMLVQAPTLQRFQRSGSPQPLEQFIADDDVFLVDPEFIRMQEACKIILSNDGSLEQLKTSLGRLELGSPIWIRPAWDFYFMSLANLASQRSNCMKRRVGAVIVADRKVVATGYNGTARNLKNCSDGGCPRCNGNVKCGQSLDTCLCLHGEENALLEAGAQRCQGATIYSTSTPCLGCTKRIIQVGIKRVVFDIEYSIDHNSKDLFDEAGVRLEKIEPALHKYYSCRLLGSC
jgi:dCMP deaminase